MATHEITLDVTKKEITPQVIHTRVGDSNTTIKATVTNDGDAYSLSGATVKFKAAKPDGTYAEQSATVSGSTATVTLAPEFLAVPGIIKTAYFEITASGKKDTTGNVWIDNRADAEGEAPDLSTSYIPSVDQRVEDATEALNSANTALGNAEEALEDAEAATDSATDAAASANAAASAAQSAIEAMTGNVLRGTVGPSEVVSADDAYAQTPLGLTVYGNTRQNLWVNPSGTNNGVTVTANENGSITLSGTRTGPVNVFKSQIYSLRPGSTYTLSVNSLVTGIGSSDYGFMVQSYNGTDFENVAWVGAIALSDTFAVPSDSVLVAFTFTCTAGNTVSGTYRVMLNEGSEAQPWCPPGLNSVKSLDIVTAGKNLLRLEDMPSPYTINGIKITHEGGTFSFSGTATGSGGRLYFFAKAVLNPGTYVISRTVPGAANVDICLSRTDTNASIFSISSSFASFEVTEPIEVGLGFNFIEGESIEMKGASIQLERGTNKTEFEQPSAAFTEIDLDGNQLCSLPDGTRDELRIDESGSVTLVKRVWEYVSTGTDSGFVAAGQSTNANRFALDNAIQQRPSEGDFYYCRCDKLGTGGFADIDSNQVYSHFADLWFGSDLEDAESFADFYNGLAPVRVLYKLNTPQEIPLDAVTLSALHAPNANVWAAAEVPCDVELEYARDVTLVIGSLEAKVAALELLHETE